MAPQGIATNVHKENSDTVRVKVLACFGRRQLGDEKETVKMRSVEAKFCLQCGGEGVVTREITPNHVIEMYCPHCGILAELLWGDRTVIGTNAEHDPDSDSEAW
jgi:hypothetical protein